MPALFFFSWLIFQRNAHFGSNIPELEWWVRVCFALYYLPDLVIVGFLRPWGGWPQAAGLLIALALLMAYFVAYGTGWAPLLACGIFIFTAF